MSDISTKGRRVECSCCGQKTTVRGAQVWRHRMLDAMVTIISAERDGAIVEQDGRPEGERFGISYKDLLSSYRRTT